MSSPLYMFLYCSSPRTLQQGSSQVLVQLATYQVNCIDQVLGDFQAANSAVGHTYLPNQTVTIYTAHGTRSLYHLSLIPRLCRRKIGVVSTVRACVVSTSFSGNPDKSVYSPYHGSDSALQPRHRQAAMSH